MNELDSIFIQASEVFDKGDYEQAFQMYSLLANKKYASAYNDLAVMYECGMGVVKDINTALFWYKKSWSTDNYTDSSKNIADLYLRLGNFRQAVFWWKKSMLRGDGEAALSYAEALINKGSKNKKLIQDLLKFSIQDSNLTADSMENAHKLILQGWSSG